MINEEISKEAGQAAQTIITYTIKAAKESINLDKEIRKKMDHTLEKANGNLKDLKKRTKQTWSKFLSNEKQRKQKLWNILPSQRHKSNGICL